MNLFWTTYKNIEKELLSMVNYIQFDDKQINDYSTKFIDILLRTSIEIEAISKQLYLDNGGPIFNNEDEMYFDTVCLKYLEDKFSLSKKIIYVNNINMYFEKNENIELTPLHKSFKRGSSGSDWKKGYQSIKHNRIKNYKFGNMKNAIHALGALFILNLYYKNQRFDFENESETNKFDLSLGSELFTIKLNKDTHNLMEDITPDDTAIYNLKLRDEDRAEFIEIQKNINANIMKFFIEDIRFNKALQSGEITLEQLQSDFIGTMIKVLGTEGYSKLAGRAVSQSKMHTKLNQRRFYAYLNV